MSQGNERSALADVRSRSSRPYASRVTRCNQLSCVGASPLLWLLALDFWQFRLCSGTGHTAISKPLFRQPKVRFIRLPIRALRQSTPERNCNKGEKVRTAKDGRAVVRLGDGSLIEMKDRSELYLTKNGQGTTIHLNRGSIVVEAAKQKDGQVVCREWRFSRLRYGHDFLGEQRHQGFASLGDRRRSESESRRQAIACFVPANRPQPVRRSRRFR